MKFKRIFDASEYKVTYLEKGERKVAEDYVDADGIQLDQYMKEYAKNNNFTIFLIIIIIVIIQMIIPVIFLRKLINEIRCK